jgi:transposase
MSLPDVVFTDNSAFKSAEFDRFASLYEFKQVTSSPRWPQSHGRVENAVKTAKRLMTKAREEGSDPLPALLEWRNAPS